MGTHKNSLASHNLDTNINKDTQVHIEGGFNLTPFRMYGKVNIKNLKPKEFISLTKDLLQFQISNTSLDINLGYTLDLKDELSLVLNDAHLHVNKFDLTKEKEKIVEFNAFNINNFNLKYPEQEITIESISLDKLFATIIKNKDESLNISSLVKQQDGHRVEEFKEEREKRKKWNIKLNTFNLNQSNFNFNDLKTSTTLSTKNINFSINKLDFDGDNITVNKINLSKPTLSIANKTIAIKTQPFNLDVNNISSDLKDFNIKSIKLEDNGVTFNDKANHTSFKGDKSQLLATDIQSKNSVITINKINTKHNDMKIENRANALNIIAKNIDVRVDKFLFKENYLSIKKSTVNRPFANIVVGKKAKKKETTKKTKNAKVVKKEPKEKSSFNFDIGPASIKNAKVTFEDKNLPVPFKTNITKLDGSFSALSSTSTKPTKLKLTGNVDKYGSTKISGLLEHKDIKELVDVKLIFKNIAIKNFTPYSGKFVGRELAGGKLNLDLNYNVKKSNLKAQNSVIISDIKLGKKVESPDAMSLPLELGIALLEDRHGIININMPLSGNVDDPDFSIAPLVWQVFTNLIVKAVTSPFSFLASLIGLEGDELKSAEFDIGVATILPHIKERLDNIAQYLKNVQISL